MTRCNMPFDSITGKSLRSVHPVHPVHPVIPSRCSPAFPGLFAFDIAGVKARRLDT